MPKIAALISCLLIAASSNARACQLDLPGEPSSWEQKIDAADVVFVGRVVSILPNLRRGWNEVVVLQIQTPIKGIHALAFEARQGSGGDCGIPFTLGDRVIFAGDSIWDPTVFLSNPPTAEQSAQLAYLKSIAP